MGSEETTEPERPASEALRSDERPASILPLVVISVVASALGIAFGLIIDWFPVQASTQAEDIDTFYDVLIIASVPVFVLVTAIVLYCVHRFRMRPGEENMDGPPLHGNTRLEVIWTVIPAIMMLGLCTYAWVVLDNAEEAPAASAQPELNVRVVGEQFAWTFFYPGEGEDGKELASTQLYLPVDRSVRFKVQSKDVLHDFWVPAFRWKIDAVPGINTFYRVTPNRTGRYAIVCAELCGLGHATMRQTANVLPPDEFESWLEEQASGVEEGGVEEGGAPDGKALFTSTGCGACHVLADAGANGTTGPNLDQTLAGTDAAFIETAIVDPDAELAEGFQAGIMPSNYATQLDPEEIDALVKYLQEATG